MAATQLTFCEVEVTYQHDHPVKGFLDERNYRAAVEAGDAEVWTKIMGRYADKREAAEQNASDSIQRDRSCFQIRRLDTEVTESSE